jgi:hypothetical protein
MRHLALLLLSAIPSIAQVSVSHTGDNWTIAGRQNVARLDGSTLAMSIKAGPAEWKMVPTVIPAPASY